MADVYLYLFVTFSVVFHQFHNRAVVSDLHLPISQSPIIDMIAFSPSLSLSVYFYLPRYSFCLSIYCRASDVSPEKSLAHSPALLSPSLPFHPSRWISLLMKCAHVDQHLLSAYYYLETLNFTLFEPFPSYRTLLFLLLT